MENANVDLVITKDGSFSFISKEFNQSYHSLNGAMSETQYVFIKNGIEYYLKSDKEKKFGLKIKINKKKIRILEVGSGSFINLFQTIKFICGCDLISNELSFEYVGLEPFPIRETTLIDAYFNNYKSIEKLPSIDLIQSIINSEWNITHKIDFDCSNFNNINFAYTKLNIKLEEYLENYVNNYIYNLKENEELFDIVYFDAFSKNKQSNLWDYEYLEQIVELMSVNSIFVTYASNSKLKNDLKSLGLELHILKGALGKREMIRAIKY